MKQGGGKNPKNSVGYDSWLQIKIYIALHHRFSQPNNTNPQLWLENVEAYEKLLKSKARTAGTQKNFSINPDYDNFKSSISLATMKYISITILLGLLTVTSAIAVPETLQEKQCIQAEGG
jgi:hypothetical protein